MTKGWVDGAVDETLDGAWDLLEAELIQLLSVEAQRQHPVVCSNVPPLRQDDKVALERVQTAARELLEHEAAYAARQRVNLLWHAAHECEMGYLKHESWKRQYFN